MNANLDTQPTGILSPGDVEDPWKLWVFRVRANGQFETESRQESRELGAGLNAFRVTPTWKQSYNANYRNNRQEFELNDGSRFIDSRYDWGFTARVVHSVAEHWSIGVRSNVGRNTRNNQSFWGQMNPAIEYSFFPYEEATRRSMTAFYEVGPVYREYFEATLLGKEEELRGEQALTLQFSQRQPWGNASVRLTRITRGLDLNVGASYSRIRDQIFLAGGALTDEERLLELQTQQTDSRASLDFGLSTSSVRSSTTS